VGSPVTPVTNRPTSACLTHPEPPPGTAYTPADPGYRTCRSCCTQLRTWLSPRATDRYGLPTSLTGLYTTLSPLPGTYPPPTGTRHTPPGPRSPANDHILAVRDPRSTRNHRDPAGDPHSVPGVLTEWVHFITDQRRLTTTARTVPEMTRFLDHHLDWITRQDWVPDFHTEIRALHRQLSRLHQPRRFVGHCPNPIPEHDSEPEDLTGLSSGKPCGGLLFAPLYGDHITCHVPGCGGTWTREQWLELGNPTPHPETGDGTNPEPQIPLPVLCDVVTIAHHYGVALGTVRRWAHQDGWAPHGTQPGSPHRKNWDLRDAQRSWARRHSHQPENPRVT
jgi:hypothetical protein